MHGKVATADSRSVVSLAIQNQSFPGHPAMAVTGAQGSPSQLSAVHVKVTRSKESRGQCHQLHLRAGTATAGEEGRKEQGHVLLHPPSM